MLEGEELRFLKGSEELVSGGSVKVMTLVILSTLFCVLSYERIRVKRGCPCWDGWLSTGFGLADKRDLADERVLYCRQENPEVAVLALYAGTLDRNHVHCDERMSVLDGRVVRFPRMLG